MKRIAIVLLLLFGTSAVAAWWRWHGETVDPQVAMLEERGKQLFNRTTNLSDDQRRAAWSEFRRSMEQLTPEQREQFRERRRAEFQRRMEEDLARFFALPKSERAKELDRRIDEMQKWRQRRRQRNGQSNSGNASTGNRGDNGGGRNGPGGGGWSGRSGWTGADRNERRQQYLNSTTPQFRAMTTEYRRLLRERAEQRGLRG